MNAWRAWRAPQGLKTDGHKSRLMLNTFHVRRGAGDVEVQEGLLQAPCGRRARRQGEKLAYANFVIDLSTPARKFNFRPRAMFDTAIQRVPNLASSTCFSRSLTDTLERVPDSRTNVISSRENDMSLYPTFIHRSYRIKNRAHDTPQKKKVKHHYRPIT